ncbi:hypothetical protein CDL12_23930 [Handroanthus impetiginosus]|uniref:Cytochrome P450 CYP2 subfamily n=1 Tax=Handroanthus impetiginosus TaxID=429701 RepID=A0A2G9GE27_9LAMI|nr:hypothetical protein CDL12_23930 [Handroanthus impetiginosus]
MEISWSLTFPWLCIIAALALISKRIAKQNPQPKLPPGPKSWPIIGNLNQIVSIPHQSLHFLSQKYGEIMLLKFGKFPVVVASSPEIPKLSLRLGGMDSSATTVEWTVQEILKHPWVFQKAKEELNRVIGRNIWVGENDFSQLPYIDAIIMESMRLHPLATLLAPHYSMGYCKVGTTVLINTWSIGRDRTSWDKPEEFLPERFMGKEINMLGSNFALLPFRSVLANLFHGFELKLVEGMKVEDICMEEEYGLTTHPKEPLEIILEPTLSLYLY